MRRFLQRAENTIFYSLLLFLPTQLGKHFWPDFSYVSGIRIDYLSPTVYFTDVIVFLLFLVWIIRKTLKTQKIGSIRLSENQKVRKSGSPSLLSVLEKEALQKRSPALIYIFVISYLLLVIVLSGRFLGGLYYLLKILEMLFVGLYSAKFVGEKNVFKNVLNILSIGVIFESLLAVFQFFKQGSVGDILYFLGERTFTGSTPGIANASINGQLILRPYATFPHPNVLAGYLVIVMTLLLFSIDFPKYKGESGIRKYESEKKKILVPNSLFLIQMLALIFGTAALFLTLSRVAILLWVLIVFYYLFTKVKKQIALIVFVLFGLSIFLTPLGTRFLTTSIKDEAVTQRESLSQSAFKMIEARPLFGVGLSNFIPQLVALQTSLSAAIYLQPVHNIFLLVAAETGFIGLGIFVWFLWKTFLRIKKQESRSGQALIILFFTILILGSFDHYFLTLQQGQLLFALIFGMCWQKKGSRY